MLIPIDSLVKVLLEAKEQGTECVFMNPEIINDSNVISHFYMVANEFQYKGDILKMYYVFIKEGGRLSTTIDYKMRIHNWFNNHFTEYVKRENNESK